MGSGSWDTNVYNSAKHLRASTGVKDFDYDDKVKTGRATGLHPDLDPKKVAGPTSPLAGRPVRESRDNDEHPETVPIMMFFDVTGSMHRIPAMLQQKLATLMDVVLAKAGIKDPQVLVGAIGDATSDSYPFQVGQFESDNRFDEQLRNIILEGGGGGQEMESYGLAYRFAAYHTATDAFEKRGRKGYLFMIGDEAPWPTVTAEQAQRIFGVNAEQDESVKDLLTRAQERWEVFQLFALEGSYRDRTSIHDKWKALLGERFIMVEDATLVCEVIAGLVHMMETAYDVDRVVDDIGLTGTARDQVKNALAPVSKNLPAHVATGGMPAGHGDAGDTLSPVG